jgi:beta-lactamase regulating signal transducer with metallopeptidase domain
MSFILSLALIAMPLLRRRSAALRHWTLATALLCVAVTPALSYVVPSLELHLPEPLQAFGAMTPDSAPEHPAQAAAAPAPSPGNVAAPAAPMEITRGMGAPEAEAGTHEAEPARVMARRGRSAFEWSSLESFLRFLWLAGVLMVFCRVVAGALRLAWIASGARPMTGDVWNRMAWEIARDYGIQRPVRLLWTRQPSLLATWGTFRPEVLLPQESAEWTDERIRVVLSHEFAHIQRKDWLIQMLSETLRAVYWFNPLLWVVCRRLHHESEQSCDDAVIRRGVASTDYAEHLVALARALNGQRPRWAPALRMARASTLDRRFAAMFDPHIDHRGVRRFPVCLTAALFVAITVPLGGLRVTARPIPLFLSPPGAIVSTLPPATTETGLAGAPAPAAVEPPAEQQEPGFEQSPNEGTALERAAGVTVSGRVKGIAPGATGIHVFLEPSGNLSAAPMDTVVPSDGSFEFRKVTSGRYNLRLDPAATVAVPIITVEDKDIAGLELTAPRMVVGRVVVEDGSTLPVQPAPLTTHPGALVTVQARRSTGRMSAVGVRADGTFLLVNLDGEFEIRPSVLPMGYWVKSMTFGETDLTTSKLRIGEEPALSATEIRIVLTTEPPNNAPAGVTVRGSVTGLPENVKLRWVALESTGGAAQGATASAEQRIALTEPAPDGTFTIPHVPPGNYTARVHTPGSPTGAGTAVLVGDREVNGINISVSVPLTPCRFQPNLMQDVAIVEEKLFGVWIWRNVLSFWGGGVRPADRIIKVTFNKDHTYAVDDGFSIFERGTWQLAENRRQLTVSGSSSRFFQGLIAFCDRQVGFDKQVGFDATYRDAEVFTWERQ